MRGSCGKDNTIPAQSKQLRQNYIRSLQVDTIFPGAAVYIFCVLDIVSEELKSKKVLLLNQLDCAGDHGASEMKQHLASMEFLLTTLSQQERYIAELEAALAQYTELR